MVSPFMKIKPIDDFDGYFISNTGLVFSNLGKGNRNKEKRCHMYQIKPRTSRNGYLRVYMRQTSTNKRVDRYIHRLVGEAFVENPDPINKTCINHKNCIRNYNYDDNLEWVSVQENIKYTSKVNHVLRDDKGRFVQHSPYYHERNRQRKSE